MNQANTPAAEPRPAAAANLPAAQLAGKYLSFHLAKEEFAVRVTQVREIIGMQELTAVPQTPVFVKGVFNLRGRVVPIISLRLKLNVPDEETTPRTCIIVADMPGEHGLVPVGVVVDGVAEVLNLQPGDIEPPPDFGRGRCAPYLLGVAKVKGRVKLLLDLDYVLTSNEVLGLEAMETAPGKPLAEAA
jgi:purine-binding chemotaxis protein CheW